MAALPLVAIAAGPVNAATPTHDSDGAFATPDDFYHSCTQAECKFVAATDKPNVKDCTCNDNPDGWEYVLTLPLPFYIRLTTKLSPVISSGSMRNPTTLANTIKALAIGVRAITFLPFGTRRRALRSLIPCPRLLAVFIRSRIVVRMASIVRGTPMLRSSRACIRMESGLLGARRNSMISRLASPLRLLKRY